MENKPYRITGYMVIPFESVLEAKDEIEAWEKFEKQEYETFEYFEKSYRVKPYKEKSWLIFPIEDIELEYRLDNSLCYRKDAFKIARERADERKSRKDKS